MATLKVKIQEDIILDNQDYGSKRVLEVSSINEIVKRVVNIGTDEIGLLGFGTDYNTELSKTYLAGQFDEDNVRYIRITNLDISNAVELAVVGAATLYQVNLSAGQSHILVSADGLMLSEADTSPSFGTMADLGSIQVNPGGNAVDVELFIASA